MTMLPRAFAAAIAAAALILSAAAASAGQLSDAVIDSSGTSSQTPPPGWSLTPALAMSRMFDDNVLVHGPGDPQEHDYVTVVNPRGDLTYMGPHGQLSMRYDGAFERYQSLDTLNSYDQHGGIDAIRKISKRSSFFLNANASASPTTELLEFTGLPYVRVGNFTDDVRSGIQSQISKRTTLSVEGHFQQARFEDNPAYSNLLLGGNAIGGAFSARHRLSERTTLTADADMLHATIGTAGEAFDIQHAVFGIERQLSEGAHVYAAGGVSRLGVTDFGPARTGPSFKLGFVEHYRATTIEIAASRSFVPSFGLGGTTQNGEVTARVHLPITRRIYTQDLVSLQQQDPLVIAVPRLRSVWLQAAVGYAAQPWVRIEAYFFGTRQTVGGVDALLHHDQFGIQVIASKPVRIR